MVGYSPAQLQALAEIRFWDLDAYGDLEVDEHAFAHLNTPHGVKRVTVNRATARRLARDRLIEAVPESEDPDGLPGRWRVSKAGQGLLAANADYLAKAGREHARVMGSLALAEIHGADGVGSTAGRSPDSDPSAA